MQKIIITLEGGIIQDISNIPANTIIEVRDFDIDGAEEKDLSENEHGERYYETLWNSKRQPEETTLSLLREFYNISHDLKSSIAKGYIQNMQKRIKQHLAAY